MRSRGAVLLIAGILVLLAGVVFSLQGADVIKGSSLMSGDPTYIYVGAVVAILGLFLIGLALRAGKASAPAAHP